MCVPTEFIFTAKQQYRYYVLVPGRAVKHSVAIGAVGPEIFAKKERENREDQ